MASCYIKNGSWYASIKHPEKGWINVRMTPQPANKREAKAWVYSEEQRAVEQPAATHKSGTIGALMETWIGSLRNRDATVDGQRSRKHLVPAFGKLTIAEVTTRRVLIWIDDKRAEKNPLADASIRRVLGCLSRFFSWAIERGHATANPVRAIPMGKRPRDAARSVDAPWIDDEAIVRKVLNELPAPFDLMFYLGNRCGMRTGEIAALTLSDLGWLSEGVIRVRRSYDGALKEDKYSAGTVKWVPAATDAEKFLEPHLTRRRAVGAGPEDLLFQPCRGIGEQHSSHLPKFYGPVQIGRAWRPVAEALKIKCTWYEATRHSFASRNASAGVALDEISAALGHSSPVVTRRYYDHFVRKNFSDAIRAGIGSPKLAPVKAAKGGR